MPKPRWATDWISWPGYDKLWTNLSRDLLPRAQAGEATAEYDGASGKLLIDYRLGNGVSEPASIPKIFAIGPGGFEKPVRVRKVAAGTFRGEVEIGTTTGSVPRATRGGLAQYFPRSACTGPKPNCRPTVRTKPCSSRWPNSPADASSPTRARSLKPGRTFGSSSSLWPGLLALAVLLSLVELVLRKWKGVFTGKA